MYDKKNSWKLLVCYFGIDPSAWLASSFAYFLHQFLQPFDWIDDPCIWWPWLILNTLGIDPTYICTWFIWTIFALLYALGRGRISDEITYLYMYSLLFTYSLTFFYIIFYEIIIHTSNILPENVKSCFGRKYLDQFTLICINLLWSSDFLFILI